MNTENPLESLRSAVVFSSKDYSSCKRDAWIYGIVVGWEGKALEEVSKKHRWDKETVERLKRLRLAYIELERD
ncbi:hypothetical protein [Acinetobacter chengduensis]|uniref:Uncharacterized protein n=1 Tax=Acinetobacter chengduensis TaxID=2420890 RepID=A0ABX9TSC0_9GAMM|nr:hypothetical protein [Acinetobacter chengduensis]RLL17998.1 hypothetical protein D9K81_16235 [Acinetobacter chengduensis]